MISHFDCTYLLEMHLAADHVSTYASPPLLLVGQGHWLAQVLSYQDCNNTRNIHMGESSKFPKS